MPSMTKLLSFLRYRASLILFYCIAVFLTLIVQYLANQNMLYAWYTAGLLSFFLLLFLIIDGIRYFRHRQILNDLTSDLYNVSFELPEANDALEADYIKILQELYSAYDSARSQLKAAKNDSLEYYTLWIHQIKTPIAAMRLVLEPMDDAKAGIIRQELFKIEQYADLALRYIKLSDVSSDLVIEHCRLYDIVHESAKKFSILFVYQQLSLDIAPLNVDVFSDKRWLMFIIEQLLSNAIKYTHAGGIRIYMQQQSLVIEDSGIGIRPEDLPMIFTKGYTGYNGRLDRRASGIGLYLSKKAADALGIALSVESTPGVGTKVSLAFPNQCRDMFM